MHLVDYARLRIETTATRPPLERLTRQLIRNVLPYPGRFRSALMLATLAKPFKALLRGIGLPQLAAMVGMAPTFAAKRAAFPGPAVFPGQSGKRRARVALLSGCAQQVLRPQINDAAIRLLASQGVEVVLAKDEGCCGALVQHMGREEEARSFARRNIDAWEAAEAGGAFDAILVTASGCGTSVKDYGHLLAHDPAYAEKAARFAGLAQIYDLIGQRIDHGIGVVQSQGART
jgi:glycolate oxidase iron-sulfur subunit